MSIQIGAEGTFGPAAAAIGNGLLKNYKMNPDDVRFFTVHTEADEDHSSLAEEIAVRYLHSPSLQEQTYKATFRRMELLYDIWSIDGLTSNLPESAEMPKLTFGFISAFNERVEPLMNGTIKAEGIELIPTYSHPAETFLAPAQVRRIRSGRDVDVVFSDRQIPGRGHGRPAGVSEPPIISNRTVLQHRLRHHEAGRPCRQKTRRCRVSANRGALDSRHLGTRLRCVAI